MPSVDAKLRKRRRRMGWVKVEELFPVLSLRRSSRFGRVSTGVWECQREFGRVSTGVICNSISSSGDISLSRVSRQLVGLKSETDTRQMEHFDNRFMKYKPYFTPLTTLYVRPALFFVLIPAFIEARQGWWSKCCLVLEQERQMGLAKLQLYLVLLEPAGRNRWEHEARCW